MASLLGSSPPFKLQSIFFNRKAGVFDFPVATALVARVASSSSVSRSRNWAKV